MTREEAIHNLKYLFFNAKALLNTEEALSMAIEALEQEPCEDAISREAVLALVDDLNDGSFEWATVRTKMAKLPSVTPQPKM